MAGLEAVREDDPGTLSFVQLLFLRRAVGVDVWTRVRLAASGGSVKVWKSTHRFDHNLAHAIHLIKVNHV